MLITYISIKLLMCMVYKHLCKTNTYTNYCIYRDHLFKDLLENDKSAGLCERDLGLGESGRRETDQL